MSDFFSKIKSRSEAELQISKWQQNGDKVVFTNGCFDLVHRGHVEYLNKAAEKGQKLVLGLNSDASVKRLKGETRPIVDEESRAILLAAFQFIDLVVLFDEDTPYELISALQPDCLVKGADYNAEDIVGYDIVTAKGGTVETISFVEGFSTSNIVERIANELK
ncbi:D-glycero-beta-D-manno-heptose 1-phosphate adenylyltransferase [Saccharicrinis aurantiacus]|uniref:D-glycero-beta-D-manno-heptose 1-phosphate adenylyltransferase n=1 Tax=Saccharicrinis aurantiacus TaxID=1849719 RepID=UPI0009502ADB|nr:D-glycero-beta-D-manno-heptose 1-phosphate adenylyltransferase [Saccharicrinis aurantiacus]